MGLKRSGCVVIFGLLAFTVMLALPVTVLAWDREAARDYAELWSSNTEIYRNSAYKDFGGNDCTNFTSQSFVAGGIQMDGIGSGWEMHQVFGGCAWGTPWAVAWSLWEYWKMPLPNGDRYLLGTYDFLPNTSSGAPPFNVPDVQRGDIVSYVTAAANNDNGFDGSTWEDINHCAIITGINSHSTVKPSWQGTLTCQHATDHFRVAWNVKDRTTEAIYTKYGYCVWGLTNSVTTGLCP